MQKILMYQEEFMSGKRLKTDSLADNTIIELFSGQDKNILRKAFSDIQLNNKELPEGLPDVLKHYFSCTSNLPKWANTKKMTEGAALFSRYGPQIMLVLGLYSLPYCYAAANGAMVLQLTKRITDDPGKRFQDTSEFVLDVMAPNAFEGRGKGIRSSQKVRLIHAIARFYVNKSGKWNEEWGMPVNQEDMAGTNLAFSLITIRGLRKMGIDISPSEASSYLHLWNVVGYILGIEESLLPDTTKEAYLLDKIISTRQFRSSAAGKDLTLSLIDYIQTTTPAELPRGFIGSYMRHFLGEEVADLLGISETFGSKTLISSLNNLNRINMMFGLNATDYFQTQHLVKMQRKKLEEDGIKNDE